MNRAELLSRILITVAIIGAGGAPLLVWLRTPLIHAKVAENGGWSPDVIHADAGEPIHLKLTSDDVVHGFAVGQMDMQSVNVLPGKVIELTLTFDKPGIYTFFCTRWCGLNHWRMRGTIEMAGVSDTPKPVSPPLYISLNLSTLTLRTTLRLYQAFDHPQSKDGNWQPIYPSTNSLITIARIRRIKYSMNCPVLRSQEHNAGMWLPISGN